MSFPEFVWSPDLGAQQTTTPRVQQTKFGDGYELRVTKGINHKPKSWSVSFTRRPVEVKEIIAFLDQRGGVEAFTWVDPMGDSGTYVCREWNSSQQMLGVYVVTGTFEQVFEY